MATAVASGELGHGLLLLVVYASFAGIRSHLFHLSSPTRRIFRFFGDISYPLYLVHLPVFMSLTILTKNGVLMLLAALVVATIVYFACDFYSRQRKLN